MYVLYIIRFYVLCTVHCSVIIEHRLNKCLFYKLIFSFLILMSSTCFEPEGSSSGRLLYVHLWYSTVRYGTVRYGTFYMHQYKQTSR